MLRDVRIAVRGMTRAKGFTALAVLTLAVGIGATTSVYSFVSGILLSPLPYEDADSLVVISRGNEVQGFRGLLLPWNELEAVRDGSESFSFVTGVHPRQAHVGGDDRPERVAAAELLPEVLERLGIEPILGRGFTSDDDATTVLVSERLWETRLGSDPAAVGDEIVVDGAPRTIVGVLPGESGLPVTRADVVLPIDESELTAEGPGGGTYFDVIARLRPGATLESARAELTAIRERLDETEPGQRFGWTIDAERLTTVVIGEADRTLALLLGAVLVVLLIACTNVANLSLARGLARERELAVRVAMGASRARIVRQLLVESGLVSLSGGALGVLAAVLGHGLLVSASPAGVPRLEEVVLDGEVLLVALALAVGSGLLAGILPALGLSRRALTQATSRATDARGFWRVRSGLTILETAMALVLLVAASLLLRSFVKVVQVDPGFSPDGAVSFGVSLPEFRFAEDDQKNAAVVALVEELDALPDVTSAAASSWTPLSGAWGRAQVSTEATSGSVEEREQWPIALGVTPGFFRTLQLPLLSGRDFSERDRTSEGGAVVVTRDLAESAWPGEEAVGRRLKFGGTDSESPWLTVVGVVGEARLVGLRNEAEATLFFPFHGRGTGTFQMFARTRGAPSGAWPSIREAVRRVDAAIPLSNMRTMEAVASQSTETTRFYLYVVGLFASGSLLLAAIGILGVVANGVVQREREMGIRLAIGADRRDVLGLVVRQGMGLVLVGVGLGLVLAFATTRLLGTLLFEVGTLDVTSFAAASAVLVIFGLVATAVPASRAAQIDPMVTLRAD